LGCWRTRSLGCVARSLLPEPPCNGAASSARVERVSQYVDELGDDFSDFSESYVRWERAEYGQVPADPFKSKIDSAVNGVVEERTEEECDVLVAHRRSVPYSHTA